MQVIQHQELASSQAYIEFTSIPQTFTDLCILVSGRIDNADGGIVIRFNGVTTGYTRRNLNGSGSGVTSFSGSDGYIGTAALNGDTANTFGNTQIYIPNYTASTAKSVSGDGVSENNGTTAYQTIAAVSWSGTDPITTIRLTPGLGNFVQYTSATLYGVLKGSDGVTTVS
jgi:hypothetical protein